ncbi:MAG: arylsulfatase, partial [Opitutales bacterium]|nr:arylsulfatase [Opitutales bacterium]
MHLKLSPPRCFLSIGLFWGLTLSHFADDVQTSSFDRAQDRPNIILILVDDMGFADLGCYGNTIIETPNLDKLAANGLRFSQFYNTARCSPTRASLLTGLYAHQAGMGYLESMNKGEGHPGYRGQLNKSCVTVAEVLRESGYLTAISGKWHIGGKYGVYAWDRGFDRSLSAIQSAFYYPDNGKAKTLHLNGEPIDPYSEKLPKDWYSSDLYAEFGLRFIDEAVKEEKPFFLYLAFNAPHFPLQAPKETIDKYKGRFADGWEQLREPIYQKQIEMGLIDENWPLSPKNPDVPDWESLAPEVKARMEHIQEIYAACVDRMDLAVGTLVEGLKERGVLDNTIIVFMSDNGACAEQGPYGRYSGPEKSGTSRSSVFQGQSWATYSNTPFRRYKHFTTEGGIATPCIVHWPEGMAEDMKGSVVHQYGHIIDIMPTFVELGNADYPVVYEGESIFPMEGMSLTPILKGKNISREKPVYWEHEGNRGARWGDWKIVAFNHQPWALFNLRADRTELMDLSFEQPDILNV